MKLLSLSATALLALHAATLQSASAHSYLTKPVGRLQEVRTDIDNSIGCPTSTRGQVTSFKAGEQIDVRYWRNNHLGGFIRWSIVKSGQAQETAQNFDKNAFFYTCRESGATCLPKGTNTRYAGDSSGANTISCGDTITLPDWLPAGDYTLQWLWFGVGSSSGNLGWAEPQFVSCADLKLTTSGAKSKAPSCPTFVGGDRVTKLENKGNNQCFYFYSTSIAKTQYKGDNNNADPNYKFGIPADVQKCGGGVGGGGGTIGGDGNSGNSTTGGSALALSQSTKIPSRGGNKKPNSQQTPAPAPAPATTPGSKKCSKRRRN